MLVPFMVDKSSSHKSHYMLHLHYSNREKMSPRNAHHHIFKDNLYAEEVSHFFLCGSQNQLLFFSKQIV